MIVSTVEGHPELGRQLGLEAGQVGLRLDVQVGEKRIEIGVRRGRETEDETDGRYQDKPTHGMPPGAVTAKAPYPRVPLG